MRMWSDHSEGGDDRVRTDIFLVASETLGQVALHPQRGRVESNHYSARRRGYSLLSFPMLSVRRPKSAADRIRTGTANGASGIRTNGLELMRLATTATPLPR
jgi:hypothetical protein